MARAAPIRLELSAAPGKLHGVDSGLYESLVTPGLRRRLETVLDGGFETGTLDYADQPHALARHVYDVTQRVLAATRDETERVVVVNGLLEQLMASDERILPPTSQLLRIAKPARPGLVGIEDVRPSTPLSDAALLTNATDEPNLGSELRAEIDTSDEVDLLCAFVKWHGLRLLEPELRRLRDARAPAPRHHDDLHGRDRARRARPAGARVRRRGQDPVRRRAHPAARQGLDVPPQHRLRHGVRRLVQPVPRRPARRRRVERPALPGRDPDAAGEVPRHLRHLLERLDASSSTTRIGIGTVSTTRWPRHRAARSTTGSPSRLVRPRGAAVPLPAGDARRARRRARRPRPPPQPRRRRDRHRQDGGRCARLPAAVRAEPADRPSSALRRSPHARSSSSRCGPTARCWPTPTSASCTSAARARSAGDHVFASVQSLHVVRRREHPADAFDIVVIDEFHHAEARDLPAPPRPPARRASCSASPRPPSAPTASTSAPFFDGRTAAELRLWDALGADLLCPFHYFAVADGTDLRRHQLDARAVRRARAVATSTPATTPAPRSCCSSCATRSSTRARCAPSASASASRTPSSWRRSSTTPASPRSRSAARHSAADRDARSAGPASDRRVNVSVRRRPVQRGPRPPRRRHGAVPAADRERHGLPAAARPRAAPHPRQGGAHGPRLRRAPPQGVPLRSRSCAPSPAQTRRGLEREIERRLPVPAVRLPDRDGPAGPGDRARRTSAPRSPTAGSRSSPSCGRTATSDLADLPRRVGRRAPRHPAARQQSWTQLRRDAGLPTRAGLRPRGRAAQADPRLRARRRPRPRGTAYRRLLADDAPDVRRPVASRAAPRADALLLAVAGRRRLRVVRRRPRRAPQRAAPPRDELGAVVDLVVRRRPPRSARAGRADSADVPLRVHAPLPARGDPRRARLRHLQRKPTSVTRGRAVLAEHSTSTPSSSR